MNIPDAPILKDLPTLNPIVMIVSIRASDREQSLASRLDIPGFVDTTALQNRLLSVPFPWQPETGMASWKNRLLELSGNPTTTATTGKVTG